MKIRFSIFYLLSSILLLSSLYSNAQPQTAWVARYHGGFTNKTHTPLALKLDSAGNIYIAGTSQNTSNVNDYVLLKYAPNGTELYATRHSSTNGMNYTANGFALDETGNTYVTGTGGTVKFDASGALAWIAPYAGKDVAVDTNGNVFVTGFASVQFATVKLSTLGSNLWVRTYANILGYGGGWQTESQKVAVDNAGRVFVAGWEAWGPPFLCNAGQTNLCRYFRPTMLCYDVAGNSLWTNAYTGGGLNWGETKSLISDHQGFVYVTGNNVVGGDYFITAKITVAGQTAWGWGYGPPGVTQMVVDSGGNAYLTGGVIEFPNNVFGTFKLGPSGDVVWQTNFFGASMGYTAENLARGVALDYGCSVYVSGVSTNSATKNDFVTIKYDNDGHQLWVLRYNGPANGNDGGTAVALAPDGAIYVTGYSANASGGSDITTIKYASPTTIQRKTDGSMQLQGFGAPGSNYVFQAATNFLNWSNVATVQANTNGLFQYLDTNAPLYPYRFYRWHLP